MNPSPDASLSFLRTSGLLAEIEVVVRPHLKFLEECDSLGVDENLGEAGLDSMASIDLLLELENRFAVSIADEFLTEDSFTSLREIEKMLNAMMGEIPITDDPVTESP